MQIIPVPVQDLSKMLTLYTSVTRELRKGGIKQWDRFYPNRFVLRSDLKSGSLYGIKQDQLYIGAVVVNEKQSDAYSRLEWNDEEGTPLCIHRLAVHPDYQGQGLGKKLLHFAEEYAYSHGNTSVRLDVYTGNPLAVGMYERAGYEPRGEVRFPFRKIPYMCFEKIIVR